MTSTHSRLVATTTPGPRRGPAAERSCGAPACEVAFSWRALRRRGLPMGALSAVVVGVPTDVIPNSLFSRMTPVRPWDYVVLAAIALMTTLWVATAPRSTGPHSTAPRSTGRLSAANLLSLLAVGCPVCNKVVVMLLGVSGAMSVWAPLQPVVAAASLGLLGAALLSRIVAGRPNRPGSPAEPST